MVLMTYEALEDKVNAPAWRVEAIDPAEGSCFVTLFPGLDSRERATEYVDFKNGAAR